MLDAPSLALPDLQLDCFVTGPNARFGCALQAQAGELYATAGEQAMGVAHQQQNRTGRVLCDAASEPRGSETIAVTAWQFAS